MRIDHIVLWVEDPLQAVAFYRDVVGLEEVRVDEFRAGAAPFPSVRVALDAIIDLMPRAGASVVDQLTQAPGSAGQRLNHVCLAMSARERAALKERLRAAHVETGAEMERSFGAQGYGRAFYFRDPDGNVLEARTYDPA
jgi:glyoxylase I family protein